MEFIAKLNYVRVSPQKARLVLGLIKGRRVEEALDTLLYARQGIAPKVYKLLRSAVENANYVSAEKGLEVDVDRLYVKRAIANDGPRLKRIRPAPMGRAYHYQRRISHIELALEEKAGQNGHADLATTVTDGKAAAPAKKAVKKPAAKKPAAKKKVAAKKGPAKKASQEEVKFIARRMSARAEAALPERGRRGEEERLWDRKSIHTDSASALPSRGGRAGSWSAITTNCCWKTSS